jgi:hypothetical protein
MYTEPLVLSPILENQKIPNDLLLFTGLVLFRSLLFTGFIYDRCFLTGNMQQKLRNWRQKTDGR